MRLIEQLSNPDLPLLKRVDEAAVRRLQRGPTPHGTLTVGAAEHRRLDDAEIAKLVDDYRSGLRVGELSAKWGVHRSTVSAHLKRRQAQGEVRGQLDNEQLDDAHRLYAEGWSLAKLGRRFGVDPKTMRQRLNDGGAEIRPKGRISGA